MEFAEIGPAVDRQVKFYSAGMAVRLGFSIAVFLDPDIMLVDEVLAVGDAHFQQKCLRRISEMVANGTTLVFVSHDLATVEAVCERALWLADSYVQAEGPTRDVLALYRASVEEQAVLATSEDGVRLLKVEITGPDGDQVHSGEEVNLKFVLRSPEAMFGTFFVGISQGTATPVFVVRYSSSFPEGDVELCCRLRNLPLPKGRYSLWTALVAATQSDLAAATPNEGRQVLPWQPVSAFEAFGPIHIAPPPGVMVLSPVYVESAWQLS